MTIEIDIYSRYQSARVGRQELDRAIIKANMSVYSSHNNSGTDPSPIVLYDRGDASFAELLLENKKSGTSMKFAITEINDTIENTIAPPPMITFSRSKNIKTTQIDNSDFEVIECFGSQSWDINLDIILIDFLNHWYPSELIKQVRKIFEVNDTFSVSSQIFDDLNIKEIYFTEISDISLVDGFNDTVKAKLKAKSIKPTEFFL